MTKKKRELLEKLFEAIEEIIRECDLDQEEYDLAKTLARLIDKGLEL
ncbi:MAG: hypothetical protein OXN93_08710 [bacterium]|nr:hypothetical protein [bacterium]